MGVDLALGGLLGFVSALPWAVYPSASTAVALRESPRHRYSAGIRGAGPRLILDLVLLLIWFFALGRLDPSQRGDTAIACISGAALLVLGFRLISCGYTTRLWRAPVDPNAAPRPALFLDDLFSIVRCPSFLVWWLLAAPGVVWLVRSMDHPGGGLAGMIFGHALVWLCWSFFLVNATRHHKGLRILDGRVHRSLIAVGGLALSLIGIYLFYFDVILDTLLRAYVPNHELGWF